MKLYLSGKITGVPDYKAKFAAVETEVKQMFPTMEIVNPVTVGEKLQQSRGVVNPNDISHGDYMKLSMDELAKCDAIYMLDCWHDSKGAVMEYVFALENGIPIYFHKNLSTMQFGTDSGRKDDSGKLDWSLLPMNLMEGVVKVLMFGARKYARDNWMKVPDGKNRYWAAMMRHLGAAQQGEFLDTESGLPHIDHAHCCMIFYKYFLSKEST